MINNDFSTAVRRYYKEAFINQKEMHQNTGGFLGHNAGHANEKK
jgi:hypothetical protein